MLLPTPRGKSRHLSEAVVATQIRCVNSMKQKGRIKITPATLASIWRIPQQSPRCTHIVEVCYGRKRKMLYIRSS